VPPPTTFQVKSAAEVSRDRGIVKAATTAIAARVLRMRFEPSVIDELLRTRWWELSDQALIELAQYYDNPQEFISAVDELRTSSS
jgi:hypothetical protein